MSLINEGSTSSCDDFKAKGGVKRLYIANKDDITSFTAGGQHSYSTVTYSGTTQFFEFEPLKGTTTIAEEGETTEGVYINNVTVESFFKRMEATKAEALNALKDACGLIVVALLWNGEMFVYGYDESQGVDAYLEGTPSASVEAELQTKQGYMLRLTGQMFDLAREYEGTVASLTA